jgi:hypothetical protein
VRLPSASLFFFRRSELSCISSYSIWCMETTPAELSVAFRIEDESQIGFWDALRGQPQKGSSGCGFSHNAPSGHLRENGNVEL